MRDCTKALDRDGVASSPEAGENFAEMLASIAFLTEALIRVKGVDPTLGWDETRDSLTDLLERLRGLRSS